jgi:hypothetical protein
MIHESSEMKFIDLSFTGKSRTGQGQSCAQNGYKFEAGPDYRMAHILPKLCRPGTYNWMVVITMSMKQDPLFGGG